MFYSSFSYAMKKLLLPDEAVEEAAVTKTRFHTIITGKGLFFEQVKGFI